MKISNLCGHYLLGIASAWKFIHNSFLEVKDSDRAPETIMSRYIGKTPENKIELVKLSNAYENNFRTGIEWITDEGVIGHIFLCMVDNSDVAQNFIKNTFLIREGLRIVFAVKLASKWKDM